VPEILKHDKIGGFALAFPTPNFLGARTRRLWFTLMAVMPQT